MTTRLEKEKLTEVLGYAPCLQVWTSPWRDLAAHSHMHLHRCLRPVGHKGQCVCSCGQMQLRKRLPKLEVTK